VVSYCSSVDQPKWAARIAADIGKRIAWWRKQRDDMSAQKLADRCAQLGMPSLSRIVITKLENGRREDVSTAELMILAQALGVPPIELLFPVGRWDAVCQIAPGRGLSPWDAALWFMGQVRLRVTPEGVSTEHASADETVPLFVQHDELVAKWYRSTADQQADVIRDLWRHRQRMRDHDLIPPDLPVELHVIEQQSGPRATAIPTGGPLYGETDR
jgi:transcriptional regulator with XRE-family HTH domain